MNGPPPPPQSFVVGSPWPYPNAKVFVEHAFQSIAAREGFEAYYATARREGVFEHTFDCGHQDKHGEFDCGLKVVVAVDSHRQLAFTAFANLTHSHPLPKSSSKDAKELKKAAAAVVEEAESEMKEAAAKRFRELKAGDSYRAGYAGEELSCVASRASQQEHLVWDLRVRLGEEKARVFEAEMKQKEMLAVDYPLVKSSTSTLDLPPPYFIPASPPALPPRAASSTSSGPSSVSSNFSIGVRRDFADEREQRMLLECEKDEADRLCRTDQVLSSAVHPSVSGKGIPARQSTTRLEAAPSFDDGISQPDEHSDDELLVLRFKGQPPPSYTPKEERPVKSHKKRKVVHAAPSPSPELIYPDAGPSASPLPAASAVPAVGAVDPHWLSSIQGGSSCQHEQRYTPSVQDRSTRTPSASLSSSPGRPAGSTSFSVPPGTHLSVQAPPVPESAPAPLRYYLQQLGVAHDPPFAAKFDALGGALVAVGVTTVPELETCAGDMLDGLVEELEKQGAPTMVLRRFKAALRKKLG
ncbi:hypothetical protein JCM10213_002416 [Rhodosporidiobolus nylandii]